MASIEEIFLSSNPNEIYQTVSNYLGISLGTLFILLAVIGIWSLVWKGLALWKASKKNSPIWFIVILVVNTVGILEILYIYVFSKMNFKKNKKEEKFEKPVSVKKK